MRGPSDLGLPVLADVDRGGLPGVPISRPDPNGAAAQRVQPRIAEPRVPLEAPASISRVDGKRAVSAACRERARLRAAAAADVFTASGFEIEVKPRGRAEASCGIRSQRPAFAKSQGKMLGKVPAQTAAAFLGGFEPR